MNSKDLTVTIIDDKRCDKCNTAFLTSELKKVPFLTGVTFKIVDFSDKWIEKLLKDNAITKLPAVIFSSNEINDGWQMGPYLKKLKDWYSLEIWATFDPYAKRSAKWFLTLDKDLLEKIKANTYSKWNKDAKVSWIEYSDLECPYCAKLHNSDVPSNIETNYKDSVNKYFNHFPLEFHKNAQAAAEVLECLWEQKGSEAFYKLMGNAFKAEKSDKGFLISEAVKLWADKATLEKCVSDEKFKEKISNQQSVWASSFGITWTPASVLVNNTTWEYEVISWAYPYKDFQTTIDSLLK